jgi:ankyrin repeat protein/Cdc6-like AAA superfamily ATPase
MQQSVTVTGNPGVGKTATMRYVALKMKDEGYTVVPTKSPEDIRNFSKKGKKILFVVDDVCGDYTLNPNLIDKWKDWSECIQSLLKNEYCKIISTCRLQIFNDVRFRLLPFFKCCECNLNSSELCFTSEERSNLALKYFEGKAGEVSDFLEEYEFFPLLCALYQKNNCGDIKSFFKEPFNFYTEEINQLSASACEKDKCKVCALVLCVIFNNRFKEEYLTTKNNEIQRIIQNTLRKSKLSEDSSFVILSDALDTLEGNMLVKVDKVYSVIHDKLYDFLAYYFGGKMSEFIIEHAQCDFISDRFLWNVKDNRTEDIAYTIFITDEQILEIYIERILRDWSKGKVLAVFKNRNIKSPSFNTKLINHLSGRNHRDQQKLAHMIDESSSDSTLLQSCLAGDPDLTRWILEHTVVDSGNSYKQQGETDVVNICRNNGVSPLVIACKYHHTEIVEMLLEYKADINKCTKSGESPLYIACQEGHLDIVLKLLDKNINTEVTKCVDSGASPLYIACQEGHLDIVLKLLDNNINTEVNKCGDSGASPLYIACQEGHLDIVLKLLDKNINTEVNKCRDNGVSPLYVACHEGHLDIVLTLLNKNIDTDVNKCRDSGASPLYIACQNGHLNIVLKLLNKNIKTDVNKCKDDGVSPLYIACQEGHLDIVLKLLDKNIKTDVNKCGDSGASPLYIACQEGHLDIVLKLLDKNIKTDVNKCVDSGASPLYVACQEGHLDIVVKLLDKNIKTDVNKCGDSGVSPLYIGCQNGHLDIVLKLLDKNINTDVNKCSNDGQSPLYIACLEGHDKIVKILLTHGADINKSRDNGYSPLQIACHSNHIDVVVELLKVQNPKVDIDICDSNECTSLFFACEKGYTNIARILLKHHADPHRCSKKGHSPFTVAQEAGFKEILDIIEQHNSHEIP